MPVWLEALNPGLLVLLLGLVCAVIPVKPVRQAITLAAPIAGIALLSMAQLNEVHLLVSVQSFDLALYRVDSLSFIFALAFLIAILINAVYALFQDDLIHDATALVYGGASVAACLVGDLISLFLFWELTAISSVLLVLQAGTRGAYGASMRYLGLQILSGVLLLFGAVQYFNAVGNFALPSVLGEGLRLGDAGALFFLLAFGIKAAFPLLHSWLTDAYPKATIAGAVVLSAFTTKLAVYALARVFPGEPLLLWIGATMALAPVLFALIEDDLRKVLAFGLMSQNGFMVAAIGAASGKGMETALNGAAGHAFVCVVYMGLLFMVVGAVMYRTGTARISELGGLFRSMPVTALFAIIGGLTLSAAPFFSAFATKSLILQSIKDAKAFWPWIMLYAASAGVLAVGGLKVPFFAFFGRNRGLKVAEAPFNMHLAMGLAAFLCIFLGFPMLADGFGHAWLYGKLPFPREALGYELYTGANVIGQLQVLTGALAAFAILYRFGLYPRETRAEVLDTDWVYRGPGYAMARWSHAVWAKAGPALTRNMANVFSSIYQRIEQASSPQGQLSRGLVSHSMAVWTAVLLGFVLILSLLIAA